MADEPKPSTLPVVDRPRPKPTDLSAGRHFGCKRSGRCCRQDGYVFVTDEELAAIAEMLGHTPAEFRERYGVRKDGKSGMRYFTAEKGQGCPLLTEDGRCSVHERKPRQCSTWPFWSELLDDENEWAIAKAMCPGMDAEDSPHYSEKQIRDIRMERSGTVDASIPFDGRPR